MQWENGIKTYPCFKGTRWKIRVNYWDGKTWRVKERHGFLTRRQAEYTRDKIRNQRFEERQFPERTASRSTVKIAMEQWIQDYAKTHCKHSTHTSYTHNLIRYIYPALGTVPVHAVTPEQITKLFLDLQAKGLAKQTMKNIFLPLKEAYGHFIARNPEQFPNGNPLHCLKPYLKYIRDSSQTVHPLSPDSRQRLLNAAHKDSLLHYAMILTALRTGLRRGELIGLHWSDLDQQKGCLHICRSMVRGEYTTPKNHQARIVDCSPQLLTVLESLLRPDTRIFPVSAAYINRMFKRVVLASGLTPMRLHDLRHTYASMLIDLGANPKYIQNQLGHSTINVTFDIYGHLFDNRENATAAKLDDDHRIVSRISKKLRIVK